MNAKLISALAFLITPLSNSPCLAWDPVKDLTGKRLDEHLDHAKKELSNAPESYTKCITRLVQCTEETIKRIPYLYMAPIVERYKQHLFNQGEGRWQTLPPYFILASQKYYPEIDLKGVRYATSVNTIHGHHITWHYNIFFTRSIDLRNDDDVHTMLHELEHTVQYQRRGGEQPFLGEYVMKSAGAVMSNFSFDVHDIIDLERAAEGKANAISSKVISDIQSVRASRPQETATVYDEAGKIATKFDNPLVQSRTIDACIKSTTFPEDRKTQCTEPAQRLIADAFCREQRRSNSVSWTSVFTGKFQSSHKYEAQVQPGGAVSGKWIPDDRGGAIFTSITCSRA